MVKNPGNFRCSLFKTKFTALDQNKKSTYLLLIRVYLLKCGIITSFNSFTFDTLYTANFLSGLV